MHFNFKWESVGNSMGSNLSRLNGNSNVFVLVCTRSRQLQHAINNIKLLNSYFMILVGLVSLFNGISTLFRLFNAKAILLEEQYYLTHNWKDKGVHTFPKGICPKVNIIAQLENELAYYNSAVHRFNHYTTRTPPMILVCWLGFMVYQPW